MTISLEQAAKICLEAFHDELPERFRWREAMICEGLPVGFTDERAMCGSIMRHEAHPYECDLPEPTDELAMALLEISGRRGSPIYYRFVNGRWLTHFGDPGISEGQELRDAIIFACAELAEREKK